MRLERVSEGSGVEKRVEKKGIGIVDVKSESGKRRGDGKGGFDKFDWKEWMPEVRSDRVGARREINVSLTGVAAF